MNTLHVLTQQARWHTPTPTHRWLQRRPRRGERLFIPHIKVPEILPILILNRSSPYGFCLSCIISLPRTFCSADLQSCISKRIRLYRILCGLVFFRKLPGVDWKEQLTVVWVWSFLFVSTSQIKVYTNAFGKHFTLAKLKILGYIM